MDFKTYRQLGLELGMGDDTSGMAPEWEHARARGNSLVDWESMASHYDPYEISPEGRERDADAPVGETIHHADYRSEAYPHTTRDFWVHIPSMSYVPSTADASQLEFLQWGCNLIVFCDGEGYLREDGNAAATVVLDNLMARAQIPLTVAVFINAGKHASYSEQRSLEYDTVSDRFVNFLESEIIPIANKDANAFRITKDPSRRAVCGVSSGGIAAFSCAWFRPDLFGGVISHVGSFTNIRGGHHYPWLIRNTIRKQIKVFLQDGQGDNNKAAGHWPLANKQMLAALEYAGYDVAHAWGEGCHSSKHGGALLPDTLRWMWPHYAEDNDQFEGGLAPWMDRVGGTSTGKALVSSVTDNKLDPYNKAFGDKSRGGTGEVNSTRSPNKAKL